MLVTNFKLLGIFPLALLMHRFHFERKSYQPGIDNESSGSVDRIRCIMGYKINMNNLNNITKSISDKLLT